MPGVLNEVVVAFRDAGVDLGALGLAWARVTPAVTIVPAFGLRALPAPARGVIALALAACIYPSVTPIAATLDVPWPLLLVGEVLRGLPVAIAAAAVLWGATMVGGMLDNLRGSQDSMQVPVIEGQTTPMAIPFTLLGGAIFLTTGGPARIAQALATAPIPAHPLLGAVNDLAGSVALAVSIGAPLLVASLVIEVTGAVIARASSPAQIHALLAPLRAMGLLVVCGIVLDRIAAVMAIAVRSVPR
ncbi:MAG TPA: flagellar biosynthetic protein FliR [Polyangiaceae bacterium]|jgi:type III secretory pathway component EscT